MLDGQVGSVLREKGEILVARVKFCCVQTSNKHCICDRSSINTKTTQTCQTGDDTCRIPLDCELCVSNNS